MNVSKEVVMICGITRGALVIPRFVNCVVLSANNGEDIIGRTLTLPLGALPDDCKEGDKIRIDITTKVIK